jgi:uncharacterized protein (TIGR03067 family)
MMVIDRHRQSARELPGSIAMNYRPARLNAVLRVAGSLLACCLIAWVASLSADPPDEAQPEGSSQEVEKLKGTWRLQSLVRDGKRAEPNEIDNVRLIFSENQYTYKNQQGERRVGTFKASPRRKPAVLETTYAEEPEQGKTIRRIYEWTDKNTLKICDPGPDEATPDNFEAPQGSGREVSVWKRVDA